MSSGATAFISGFAEAARPALIQMSQERKRKKREEERRQALRSYYLEAYEGADTTTVNALVDAQLAGASVSPSVLQKKPDIGAFLDAVNAPDVLKRAHQAGMLEGVNPMGIINIALNQGGEVEMTPERMDEIAASGMFGNLTGEQLGIMADMIGIAGMDITKGMMDKGDQVSDIDLDWGRIDSITKGKSFNDLSTSKKLELYHLGISEKELRDAFGENNLIKIEELKTRREVMGDIGYLKAMMIQLDKGLTDEEKHTRIEEIVREKVDFLQGGRLSPRLQEVLSHIKKKRKGESKNELRQRLEDERPNDVTDEEIDKIIERL